ncbi:MAG: YggS family pyridoxal phosphate-dependent enzyme [Candidatus Aminicenantes bacterium]|nr:MAG: YggS family pyridoxal phosphate-dependent enzyme [Candidatus Aminicenantes bacterium]
MSIKDNYQKIMGNVRRGCQRVARSASEVQIMGVAKSQPTEKIKEAYQCGVRLIGENKTQEADIHQADLRDLDIKWHFIGKLQKNKINRILKSFDFIQSVDGVKSLEHIHKRVSDVIEVFIEINIGEEKNKSGFTVDGLKKALNYVALLDRVKITGLMSIPPICDDPEEVRPYFKKIRELKDEINSMNLSNFDIRHLSMGMSEDYEIAVEEGATIIRIGTALFGRRLK